MKEIGKLIHAVQSRDNQALAQIANRQQRIVTERDIQQASAETKQIVNDLFARMSGIFPAMKVRMEQDPESANHTRRQWLMAFMEAGISSQRQIDAGLRMARKSEKPFFPSPGEFVGWCRDGFAQELGLPSVEDVMTVFRRYCRDRGVVNLQDFPWPGDIYFHIVPRIHREMMDHNLAEPEVRKKAAQEIQHWAGVLSSGGAIPPIRLQIANGAPKERPRTVAEEMGLTANAGAKRAAAMLAKLRNKQ